MAEEQQDRSSGGGRKNASEVQRLNDYCRQYYGTRNHGLIFSSILRITPGNRVSMSFRYDSRPGSWLTCKHRLGIGVPVKNKKGSAEPHTYKDAAIN